MPRYPVYNVTNEALVRKNLNNMFINVLLFYNGIFCNSVLGFCDSIGSGQKLTGEKGHLKNEIQNYTQRNN